MHCSDPAPADVDDASVSCTCGQRLLDDDARSEEVTTADPQALLDELDAAGLLAGRGPLLLLLRGWGAEQRLVGWTEPAAGSASAGEEGATDDDEHWWLHGDGSKHDQVVAGLAAAGLRADERWKLMEPGAARAALVIRRPGRVVFDADDLEWVDGLHYGSNHAGTEWTDCYLVTEHGWSGYLDAQRGAFGPSPALRTVVGGGGQSGAP